VRSIVWSSHAEAQYLAVVQYLSERNSQAAAKLVQRVEEAAESLGKRPIGRPGRATDTFEKIILKTSYVFVYELCGDELRILRIFHMAQDWHDWRKDEGA